MKSPLKDQIDNIRTEDDTLYGLLSMYKIYNTYFRIIINEEDKLALQITDNPKKWPKIGTGKYKDYKLLKRSEIGTRKLSVKYLSPKHLINQLGSMLGLKLQEKEVSIVDNLNTDGFYSIETDSKYLPELLILINRIIDLTPKKKYEFIEKSLSKDT